jgi:hypothetical protein
MIYIAKNSFHYVISFLLTFVSTSYAYACPNLSGSYAGACRDNFKPVSASYIIEQNTCDTVRIKMGGFLSPVLHEDYDLRKIRTTTGENGNMYISAAYSENELVTSVTFETSNVRIEVTHYSLEEISGIRYLNVDQETFGLSRGTHRMHCHLPAQ